jgi:hypothetical protein
VDTVLARNKALLLKYYFAALIIAGNFTNVKQIYFVLEDKLNQNLEGTIFLKRYPSLRDNEHYEWSSWAIYK